jgi:hypothetical protein
MTNYEEESATIHKSLYDFKGHLTYVGENIITTETVTDDSKLWK